jgi:hypothetical protein
MRIDLSFGLGLLLAGGTIWAQQNPITMADGRGASPSAHTVGDADTRVQTNLIEQVAELNRQLIAISSRTEPSQAAGLLHRRAEVLRALMISDPSSVLTIGLPRDVVAILLRIAPGSENESEGEWRGFLEEIVNYDIVNHKSCTKWYLRDESGRV